MEEHYDGEYDNDNNTMASAIAPPEEHFRGLLEMSKEMVLHVLQSDNAVYDHGAFSELTEDLMDVTNRTERLVRQGLVLPSEVQEAQIVLALAQLVPGATFQSLLTSLHQCLDYSQTKENDNDKANKTSSSIMELVLDPDYNFSQLFTDFTDDRDNNGAAAAAAATVLFQLETHLIAAQPTVSSSTTENRPTKRRRLLLHTANHTSASYWKISLSYILTVWAYDSLTVLPYPFTLQELLDRTQNLARPFGLHTSDLLIAAHAFFLLDLLVEPTRALRRKPEGLTLEHVVQELTARSCMALYMLGEVTKLSLYAVSAHCVAKLLDRESNSHDFDVNVDDDDIQQSLLVRSCQRLLSMSSANFYLDELCNSNAQAAAAAVEEQADWNGASVSLRMRLSRKGYPLLVQMNVMLMMNNLQEAILLASKMEKCGALSLPEKEKAYRLIFEYLLDTDKLFIDKTTPVEKSLLLSFAPLVGPVGMHVFEQSYHLLSKELPQGPCITEVERRYVWFASHQTLLKLMIVKYTLEKALKRFQTFKSLKEMPYEQQERWVLEFLAANREIPPSMATIENHAGSGLRACISELMTRGVQAPSPAKLTGGNEFIEIEDSDVVRELEEAENVIVEPEHAGGVLVPVGVGNIMAHGVQAQSPAKETGGDDVIDIEDSEVLRELEETDNVETEQLEEEEEEEESDHVDYSDEFEEVDEGSEEDIEAENPTKPEAYEGHRQDVHDSEHPIELDDDTESEEVDSEGSERSIEVDDDSQSDKLDDESECPSEVDDGIQSDKRDPIELDDDSQSDELDDEGSGSDCQSDQPGGDKSQRTIELDDDSQSDQLDDDESERSIERDDDKLDGDGSERPIELDDDSHSEQLDDEAAELPIKVDNDSHSEQLNDDGSKSLIEVDDDSDSEQINDDGSESRVEADGDSEQGRRDKPPTAQRGDNGPEASVELGVNSDRLQEHNYDAGHPVDKSESIGHGRQEEIESVLDLEQITSIISGARRPDGDETADEESVAAIFRPDEDPTGFTKADALETVVEEEEVVEVLRNHSSITNEFSPSRVEAGYEAEDSQGQTEEDEEVSEAIHTEDEEEERLQVGESRQIRSVASADTRAEQTIRRLESNTLSDMDAADEMTTEHEDGLGGESSEEMAEPHVHYAPYTPIAGDQAIVSLYDHALSAQRQDETQRGNNPTMPSPEVKPPRYSFETYQKASLESGDQGEERDNEQSEKVLVDDVPADFQVETSVEAADIKPGTLQLKPPVDSPKILPVHPSDSTMALAVDASQRNNDTDDDSMRSASDVNLVDHVSEGLGTPNQLEDDTANVEDEDQSVDEIIVGDVEQPPGDLDAQDEDQSVDEIVVDAPEEPQGDLKGQDADLLVDESVVDAVEEPQGDLGVQIEVADADLSADESVVDAVEEPQCDLGVQNEVEDADQSAHERFVDAVEEHQGDLAAQVQSEVQLADESVDNAVEEPQGELGAEAEDRYHLIDESAVDGVEQPQSDYEAQGKNQSVDESAVDAAEELQGDLGAQAEDVDQAIDESAVDGMKKTQDKLGAHDEDQPVDKSAVDALEKPQGDLEAHAEDGDQPADESAVDTMEEAQAEDGDQSVGGNAVDAVEDPPLEAQDEDQSGDESAVDVEDKPSSDIGMVKSNQTPQRPPPLPGSNAAERSLTGISVGVHGGSVRSAMTAASSINSTSTRNAGSALRPIREHPTPSSRPSPGKEHIAFDEDSDSEDDIEITVKASNNSPDRARSPGVKTGSMSVGVKDNDQESVNGVEPESHSRGGATSPPTANGSEEDKKGRLAEETAKGSKIVVEDPDEDSDESKMSEESDDAPENGEEEKEAEKDTRAKLPPSRRTTRDRGIKPFEDDSLTTSTTTPRRARSSKRYHDNVPDNASSAAGSRKRRKSDSTSKGIDDSGIKRPSTRHAQSKEEISDHENEPEDTPSEPTRRTRSTPARKGKAPATSSKKRIEEESASDSRLSTRQRRTTRAVALKKKEEKLEEESVVESAKEESMSRATRSTRQRGKAPITASKKIQEESDSESAIDSKRPTRQTRTTRAAATKKKSVKSEEEEESNGGEEGEEEPMSRATRSTRGKAPVSPPKKNEANTANEGVDSDEGTNNRPTRSTRKAQHKSRASRFATGTVNQKEEQSESEPEQASISKRSTRQSKTTRMTASNIEEDHDNEVATHTRSHDASSKKAERATEEEDDAESKTTTASNIEDHDNEVATHTRSHDASSKKKTEIATEEEDDAESKTTRAKRQTKKAPAASATTRPRRSARPAGGTSVTSTASRRSTRNTRSKTS